jgi:hypothetical protein
MELSKHQLNITSKCTAEHEASRQSLSALQIHLDHGRRIPASKHDLDIPPEDIAGRDDRNLGDGGVVRDYFEVGVLAELCVRAGTRRSERAYNAGSG